MAEDPALQRRICRGGRIDFLSLNGLLSLFAMDSLMVTITPQHTLCCSTSFPVADDKRCTRAGQGRKPV